MTVLIRTRIRQARLGRSTDPWQKVQTFTELGLVILQKVLDKSAFYFPIDLLLRHPYG